MHVAFVLYDQMTALDLVGPYEALAGHPQVKPHFVAAQIGGVRCDNGLTLQADVSFNQLPRPELIIVPGSLRWRTALADEALIAWLGTAAAAATWTISVCSGSTLLGKAGILTGRPATTHWAVRDVLAAQGAILRDERVVIDGDVITCAGPSAGIDMALTLAARLWGEPTAKAIQLALEYDPQPPFDCGSPDKAPDEIVTTVRNLLASA